MIFFACLFMMNISIQVILMMSHFFSMIEFIDYCNKVLPNEDRNMPYVFAGFSGITAYALLAIGGGIWYYQLIRQIRIFRSNVNHFIVYCKIFISVNIIYILSYFSPFMILAFLHDPLATFSTYFLIIIGILSFTTTVYLPMFYAHKFRSKRISRKNHYHRCHDCKQKHMFICYNSTLMPCCQLY